MTTLGPHPEEPTNFVLGQMLGDIGADVKQLLTRQADHETRIRKVERKVWWASAAVTVAIGYVSAKLKGLIGEL